MRWQLQEAKNRLSEVVKAARSDGPQLITVHGEDAAVLVGIDEFRKLKGRREPLGTFLRKTAPKGVTLELERVPDPPESHRDVRFDVE